MSAALQTDLQSTRREFLKLTTAGTSALVLGFHSPLFAQEQKQEPFAPNVWVRIEPDNRVTLTIGKSEMGQGVRTALAMILADELDSGWDSVELAQGRPGPIPSGLGTGGSFSVRAMWMPLRTAGAAAREMLVAAAAARWTVDVASLRTEQSAVIHAASGRRLSYGELAADAAKLPVPATPKLKEIADFRLIGKRTKRIDGGNIVSGKATYGLDVRLPGMLYASIERPPVIGGSVKSFDATRARKVAGVVDVMQVSRGVAVIARDSWSALQGREALEVVFDDGGFGKFNSAAYIASFAEAAAKEGINTRREGDLAAAATRGVRTIEADYHYPFYAHAPLEPMNTTAWVHDGRCEIWSPTQAPHDVQDGAAKILGIPKDKIDVHVTLIGGGFGRRLGWDYANDAVEVARHAGKPVQVFWSRADDMKHGYFQAPSLHRMRAALDADGAPVLWSHKKVSTYHNARRGKPNAQQMGDGDFNRGSSWGVYDVPYTIGAIETSYVFVDTHVPIGPWRAVFAPSSVSARESFFDEVATAAGRDPLQFRIDLLGDPDLLEVGHLKISRHRMRRLLETLREKSNWRGAKSSAGRGRGVACDIYDGVTHVGYVVDVAVDGGKVRVERVICAIDCGQVVNPTGIEQQVEGGVIWGMSSVLKGEITITNGEVDQSSYGDFDVLRLAEAPRIETHILSGDRPMPFGVGEPPVVAVVPAIVNAIHAATGKRVRKLPVKL